jgi:hypothetical protein
MNLPNYMQEVVRVAEEVKQELIAIGDKAEKAQ